MNRRTSITAWLSFAVFSALFLLVISRQMDTAAWCSCRASLEARLRQVANEPQVRARLNVARASNKLTEAEIKWFLTHISLRDLDCRNFRQVLEGKDINGADLIIHIEPKDGSLYFLID